MSRLRNFILYSIFFIFICCSLAFGQMAYDAGDWTSYRDFRFARAVDASSREVFIATSGGILEYNLYRQMWRDPMAVGFGLNEAVDLDDPALLLFDAETSYLWVATRTQLLQYDANAESWRRIQRDVWGPQQRVVNLGVGGDGLYVETVPAQIYERLFLAGSPLPLPDWQLYVTRYRGSRTFGGLMIDIGSELNPGDIQWRGLRTRRPLSNADLQGNLGMPPANFPSLLMPGGWVLQADGTLLDPQLRGHLVTDWIVDRFSNLWMTVWGAGVLKGDLRAGRTEIHTPGPAGQDIRALAVGEEDVWMGGFSSGPGQGISRASRDLKNWRDYESRDNSRIRSTELFDIAHWNGSVWFATDEGLLEFQEKKGDWKLYTVGEDLQSDHIRALMVADTELWIGNASGLAVIGSAERKIRRISVPQLGPSEIIELTVAEDTLYVSTVIGLYKGALETLDFDLAPLDPGLLNAPAVDMVSIGPEVWSATPEGIQIYDQASGRTQAWHAVDWMNSAVPTCLAVTGPYVWVGTRDQGFYRLHRESGHWISYTTADGLIDNHVQVIRPDGDDLLIGTTGGLTRFYWNRPGRPR